jgi:hypothetical protein
MHYRIIIVMMGSHRDMTDQAVQQPRKSKTKTPPNEFFACMTALTNVCWILREVTPNTANSIALLNNFQ